MSYKIHSQYGWPTQQEKTLLRAILLNGDAAIEAWHEWRDNLTGTALDKSVSSVFPSLYLKLKQQEMEIDDGGLLRERYTKTLLRSGFRILWFGLLQQNIRSPKENFQIRGLLRPAKRVSLRICLPGNKIL